MYKWFILTYLTRVLWGLVNICKAFMDMQHIKYHETAPSYLTCMTWKRMLVFLSISRFSFLSTSHNTETFSCLASPIFSCWTGTAKPELCSSQWFTLLEGGGEGEACAEESVWCCLGLEMSRKLPYKRKWIQTFQKDGFLSITVSLEWLP